MYGTIELTIFKSDQIASIVMLDDICGAVELNNGRWFICDCEDYAEVGEVMALPIPGKQFPRKCSREYRIAYMRKVYEQGA